MSGDGGRAARSAVSGHAAQLTRALLAADRRWVERVIDAALSDSRDGIAVLDELLAPVMRQIGHLWEDGDITVADEHLATAIAHATLPRIYPRLVSAPPRSRGVVLLAGADGEQHVFGLRMVADVLEGGGYDVRNVGGSLPSDALAAAVRRHRPVLVGLADTMGAGSLRGCIDAVRMVDRQLAILLGGAGAAADLAVSDPRVVVCASARAALTAARRLTP